LTEQIEIYEDYSKAFPVIDSFTKSDEKFREDQGSDKK